MTRINPIIYISLASLFFFSCCRDESPCDTSKLPRKTYPLTQQAKAIVRYSGDDTLKFLKNTGDTIIYIGQGIDTFYRESVRELECDGEIAMYEGNKIVFNSSFGSPITINLTYPEFDPGITGMSIQFEKPYSFFLSTQTANGQADYDSMKVNNKMYYDVFILSNAIDDILYYTVNDGIIRIAMPSQQLSLL